MKNNNVDRMVWIFLCLSLPFIYGCNGGGGSGSGASGVSPVTKVFEESMEPAEFLLSLDADDESAETRSLGVDWQVFDTQIPEKMATTHNPEPGTLLLFGFGAAMMAKRLKKKTSLKDLLQ